MSWVGKWRNQYGSIIEITDDADHKVSGRFRTALEDSGFFGQEIEVAGYHQGDCIGLAGGGKAKNGDSVVTYTGILREGKLETLWFVVADQALVAPAPGQPARLQKTTWWRAMQTSADTFERVA